MRPVADRPERTRIGRYSIETFRRTNNLRCLSREVEAFTSFLRLPNITVQTANLSAEGEDLVCLHHVIAEVPDLLRFV